MWCPGFCAWHGQGKDENALSSYSSLVLDLSGLARVDFFLDWNDGRICINEVNTMPDFTRDSVYPKLLLAVPNPFSNVSRINSSV